MNPFNHSYFLGYVNEIQPSYIKVHFPSSTLLSTFHYKGQEFNGGLVGNFIVIEGEKRGFLGKILELGLPDSERKEISEKALEQKESEFHPSGKIELLLNFDIFNIKNINKGVGAYPHIGAKVYACSPHFFQHFLKDLGSKNVDRKNEPLIELGKLTANNVDVTVSQNALFGRHCAVIGTTGGGKSWTIARLLESSSLNNSKLILIDATGEYNCLGSKCKNINLGVDDYYFHYSKLTVDDLFYLLRPSSKTQVPKLMEAIRSLKMAKLNEYKDFTHKEKEVTYTTPVVNGIVTKANNSKRAFEVFQYKNISSIDNNYANFDIQKLAVQITNECIWDTDRADITKWGGRNDTDISYCISLISRIRNIVDTKEYNSVFGFKDVEPKNDLTIAINEFLCDEKYSMLRLNFEAVNFDFQVREILANAIGKFLLNKARLKEFKESPIILFVDEAHQFLNKQIRDEYFDAKPLDAFDQIAKECRKCIGPLKVGQFFKGS